MGPESFEITIFACLINSINSLRLVLPANESVNGLVRRCFPKGTDFSKITAEQVAKVESIINNRPRKCLGYKTPLEDASAFVALAP
jgi:hypothetical protein